MSEPLDVARVRSDFPLLAREVHGRPVVYLDNAATTPKPRVVLEAMRRYDEDISANIHRGKHLLSEEASELFEDARRKVARFLNAAPSEVVFTHNTTHSLNLVALGSRLDGSANVVTTVQEHHSVLMPFLQRTNVRFVPVGKDGRVDPQRVFDQVDDDTALIAVAWASNATGAVQPIAEITRRAREKGIPTLVDGAQAVPHLPVDVDALGCDFLAFSGHKMLGPTGVGVLWGKRDRLEALGSPLPGGGSPRLVTPSGFTLKPVPHRLEAGTPAISQVIGLGAAVDYLQSFPPESLLAHERALAERLTRGLQDIPGVELLGPPAGEERLALASLVLHSQSLSGDHVAMILSDTKSILVRSGHHCCHPYFDSFGANGAVRASAYLYNTLEDIDAFTDAFREIVSRLYAS